MFEIQRMHSEVERAIYTSVGQFLEKEKAYSDTKLILNSHIN